MCVGGLHPVSGKGCHCHCCGDGRVPLLSCVSQCVGLSVAASVCWQGITMWLLLPCAAGQIGVTAGILMILGRGVVSLLLLLRVGSCLSVYSTSAQHMLVCVSACEGGLASSLEHSLLWHGCSLQGVFRVYGHNRQTPNCRHTAPMDAGLPLRMPVCMCC